MEDGYAVLRNDLLCLFHGSVFSVNLQGNLNVDYVVKATCDDIATC